MSKVKLTAQQNIAATAKGNALLVSAAAGSGKTMVLVQRLMNMICNDEINADITAYSTKYERLLFVVYDLGVIRDEAEFRRDIENAGANIKVVIVKQ